MNTKKWILPALLLITLFFGCMNEPREKIQNGDFTVEFLFEQNGCKMYRFEDGGRFVYWADCEGRVVSSYKSKSHKTQTTKSIEAITTVD
jgi:hypothetical protein